MKTNDKVAPMSFHCKLSTLVAHLRSMSEANKPMARKHSRDYTPYPEPIFKRYI